MKAIRILDDEQRYHYQKRYAELVETTGRRIAESEKGKG